MAQPSEGPFRSFYFDCDSTLSSIEGVDELTRGMPEAEQRALRALTEQAMLGELPLEQVYERRLHVVAPSARDLAAIGRRYVEHPSRDAVATVAALQFLGKRVGIVSGGLRQGVAALAEFLGIDDSCVHAVQVLLDADGRYRDFDRSSPLWRNGGKIEVMRRLPPDHHPVLFVGDGVTDLEVQGHVARFVGFGGVERRPPVAARAEVYLEGPSLAAVLGVGLCDDEKTRLLAEPRFAFLRPMLEQPQAERRPR
ncbi:MAG: HAD-IB family phosphatase [Planctomycetes bacterium]|nr:HAD-IB family phosphatase [Planctomycetota bacterium]